MCADEWTNEMSKVERRKNNNKRAQQVGGIENAVNKWASREAIKIVYN